MKLFKTLSGLLFITAIIICLIYYFSLTKQDKPRYLFPKLPPKKGVIDVDWAIFNDVAISSDNKVVGDYTQEIKSIIGKRVRILGAAYLLQQGVVNNEIHCFILMPQEKADLSIPNSEPKIQQMLTVYVDYRVNPLPLQEYLFHTGQSLPLFYVEGIFQLSTERNFGLFILNDSFITPFVMR